jgi:cell wall-associated NlpC family hydrolase
MQPTAFEPTGCPNHHTIPPTSPEPSIRIPADSWPVDPRARAAATAALAYAWAQVGKPYVWGAAGPDTFDCSGLVQASWAAAGVAIGRTTATQVHDGTPVPDLEQLQPGDLLFIPGDDGTRSQPRHVGLFTGRGQVIDAYSASRGIVLEPLARWAPKIVAIRRVAHPARPGR